MGQDGSYSNDGLSVEAGQEKNSFVLSFFFARQSAESMFVCAKIIHFSVSSRSLLVIDRLHLDGIRKKVCYDF